MITNGSRIEYWRKHANHDYKIGYNAYEGVFYSHVSFMCHLVDDYKGRQYDVAMPLWLMRKDFRIEPHLIARERDYAGFLDEIERTGIVI
jgi:hypothetical protein